GGLAVVDRIERKLARAILRARTERVAPRSRWRRNGRRQTVCPELLIVAHRGYGGGARAAISHVLEQRLEVASERKPEPVGPVRLRGDRQENRRLKWRESAEPGRELVQRSVEGRLEGRVDEDDQVAVAADHAVTARRGVPGL